VDHLDLAESGHGSHLSHFRENFCPGIQFGRLRDAEQGFSVGARDGCVFSHG